MEIELEIQRIHFIRKMARTTYDQWNFYKYNDPYYANETNERFE